VKRKRERNREDYLLNKRGGSVAGAMPLTPLDLLRREGFDSILGQVIVDVCIYIV
jgi:hypothetical protein